MAQIDTSGRDPAGGGPLASDMGASERDTAEPRPPPSGQTGEQLRRDVFICVLVAVAEGVLVMIAVSGNLSLPSMLLVHCMIMLGLTLVLDQRERNRLDSRVLAVAVVTTAVSGPIGAAMSALLGLYLRFHKLETELLANWYERISGHGQTDAVVELHERIQAGRTLNPYVDARARFGAILRSGPMEEKQRVLSVITQKYHPSFAGLLQLALRNQDPPIRVQAAAVAARLKEQERLKVKHLIAQVTEIPDGAVAARLDLAAQVIGTLDSGLLDEQEATSARFHAKAILGALLARAPGQVEAGLRLAGLLAAEGEDGAAAALLRPLAAGSEEARALLRATLLRQKKYVEAADLNAAVTAPALPGSSPAATRDAVGDAA